MNIYDYVQNPVKAVKGGYKPCYLDKVSAWVTFIYSFRWFRDSHREFRSFGMEETVMDNLKTTLSAIIWLLLVITSPLSCWLIALLPIGGKVRGDL